MGGGIAICFANAGIPVTLLDADPQALQRGLSNGHISPWSIADASLRTTGSNGLA